MLAGQVGHNVGTKKESATARVYYNNFRWIYFVDFNR